jgi:hypothetical protein
MKGLLGLCLLALAAVAACSVDVGKLRAVTAKNPDAAAYTAPDLGPDIEPGATSDADGPGSRPDVPTATFDADAPADDGPEADAPAVGDAMDAPETAKGDSPPDDAASVTPDLPVDLPDLPPVALDLPEDSSDLPDASPDLARPDVEDSAPADAGPETAAVDALRDLGPPADTRETGGQGNGSACTSADQCQSGFCIGSPGRCCVQSCSSACYRANQCATTGACVAAVGTITCGDLDALCGLSVRDYVNAGEWSLRTNLQVGDLATGSDPHTISAVPSELRGSPWIRPSRDSKSATMNPLVTFTLSAPADVYVGIDTRLSVPPWLSSWTDSGMTISYLVYSSSAPSTTVTQRLLQARFPAGDVSLGPLGCVSTSNCSMYLTIIRFADRQGDTPPTCR